MTRKNGTMRFGKDTFHIGTVRIQFVGVDAHIDPRPVEIDQGFTRGRLIKMQDVSLEKLSLIGYDKINQRNEEEPHFCRL